MSEIPDQPKIPNGVILGLSKIFCEKWCPKKAATTILCVHTVVQNQAQLKILTVCFESTQKVATTSKKLLTGIMSGVFYFTLSKQVVTAKN